MSYVPNSYDPLGTENITAAICREMELQPPVPFVPEIEQFAGSGLYAIYYKGSEVELYAPLRDYEIPLYVGQAQSHNSSTGTAAKDPRALWSRAKTHRASIAEGGLPLGGFRVRLLLLPDVHADLGENGLRVFYKPVWNAVLTGFGSKEQGPTTRQSQRSKWDTVHPGRSRTFGEDKRDPEMLAAKVRDHIKWQITQYDSAPWRNSRAGKPAESW